jgi:PAS domain S-box-containing protein
MAPTEGISLRLRFAGYVVAIALIPVVVVAWALHRQAATNETRNADIVLQPELRRAAAAYAAAVTQARDDAETLAASPALQRALERHDHAAVAAIVEPHKQVAVLQGARTIGGKLRRVGQPLTHVSVQVQSVSGSDLGQIYVTIPFDAQLMARLRREGRVDASDVLVLDTGIEAIGGPAGAHEVATTMLREPTVVSVGDQRFRAVGTSLGGTRHVLVMRPQHAIDTAISHARLWIYLGAAGVLAFVGLLAYLFAPAIARGRLLQQQRAQAATVLSEVGDGVFLLDRDGRMRLWNPAAETILGIPAEQAIGREISDVIPAWPTVEPLIPSANRSNGDSAPAKALPVEVAGKELWLSFAGADFAEGRVYTFRDLSEEHRVEELKMDFVATVSHELRTPLAAISGAAVTLRQRADALAADTRGQLLSVITEQTERLAGLIDDILLAGRLAYGRLAASDETFDPVDVTRRVVDELRTGAVLDAHEVDLRLPSTAPRVEGDAVKARQVLANLVENAAKYSPGGGTITVSVEPNGRYVQFAVRDEGLGISRRDQERIFEKFYRVDPLMKQGVSGTGLGLYICRELVQHMGGRIGVRSSPGAGSTFTVELPVAEPDVVASGFEPGPGRRRVLGRR